MESTTKTQTDGVCNCEFKYNTYATKKTLTQEFLDLALLVANVAQLKFVLDSGNSYPQYVLLIVLLSISILLQIVRGTMNVVLASLYNIKKENHQAAADVINNVVMALSFLSTVVNAVISGVDMTERYSTLNNTSS